MLITFAKIMILDIYFNKQSSKSVCVIQLPCQNQQHNVRIFFWP